LHVEEERSEGALRGIGIMLSLLAFLLLSCSIRRSNCRRTWSASDVLEAGGKERVIAESGECAIDIEVCTVLAEYSIGESDVGGGEGLNRVLESRKPCNKLFIY
jgi:hypothetical protein